MARHQAKQQPASGPVPDAERPPGADGASAGAGPSDKRRKKDEGLVGWIKSLAIAFVMWLILRSTLVAAFHITSGSMEPTLLVGDVLFVNRAIYGGQLPLIGTGLPGFRQPRRHEIIIFDSVDSVGLTVVKRLIGMPGDTIGMRDNVLYINGQRQNEPYVVHALPDSVDFADPKMALWQTRRVLTANRRDYHPTLKNWGPVVIPPDSFFVMGDNRDDSYDSRYWGFLGRDRVRGKAALIYYSYNPNGVLPLPVVTAVRWGRLFTRIR